ncbi:hypothetical protein [Microbacterium aurugineum]|uniref:Flagellar protein FlgN n=1 Tax=Microbacterium aurugineum TaxID=2851642 RepID=A0ABY4IWW8_9MICO|nr:hypothetical protein [Microbacterium aurugineum]UPL17252.1 hypothetical protein KV397_05515 [Microbacterium aurugineum]
MATIKQLETLMALKTVAGEEFDRDSFIAEWLNKSHKLIRAEFSRLNSNQPATNLQLAWIAKLEQEVYGNVYSLGMALSYQDACERIPLLKLMLKEKQNNQRIEKQAGVGPLSEIELLETRLRMLKDQASASVDEKTGDLVMWYHA